MNLTFCAIVTLVWYLLQNDSVQLYRHGKDADPAGGGSNGQGCSQCQRAASDRRPCCVWYVCREI